MAGQYSCFIHGVGYTFLSLGYALGNVSMGMIVTDHVSWVCWVCFLFCSHYVMCK